jgi:hypothetical protein
MLTPPTWRCCCHSGSATQTSSMQARTHVADWPAGCLCAFSHAGRADRWQCCAEWVVHNMSAQRRFGGGSGGGCKYMYLSTAAGSLAVAAVPATEETVLSFGCCMCAGKALGFLSRWQQAHPTYKEAASAAGPPPDSSQLLSHASRWGSTAAVHSWQLIWQPVCMSTPRSCCRSTSSSSSLASQLAKDGCTVLSLGHCDRHVALQAGISQSRVLQWGATHPCPYAALPVLCCLTLPDGVAGCLRAPQKHTRRTQSCSWHLVCSTTSTGAMTQPLQRFSAHWSCDQGTTGGRALLLLLVG